VSLRMPESVKYTHIYGRTQVDLQYDGITVVATRILQRHISGQSSLYISDRHAGMTPAEKLRQAATSGECKRIKLAFVP